MVVHRLNGPSAGLKALAECRELEFLALGRRTSFQFGALPLAPSLRTLKVEMPSNLAIAEIVKATQLRSLELLGGPKLASLEPLAALQNLEKLRLWSGNVESSRGLRLFPKLEHLDLGYSKLQDTTELGDAKTLRTMELIGNKRVADLEFLRDGNLETLRLLEIPKLASLKPILRLSRLREFKSSALIADEDLSPLTLIPTLEKAVVSRKCGLALKKFNVDSRCIFEGGRETFKLTRNGPKVLETAQEAKERLRKKLGLR